MTELERPVPAELVARSAEAQLIRSSEKLVVDDFSVEVVTEVFAVAPLTDDRSCLTHQILFAESESSQVWRTSRSISSKHDGDFVSRCDCEINSAGIIWKHRNGGICKIWLRTKNSFRLEAPQLAARHSRPERQEACNDVGIRSGVKPRELPDHAALKTRPTRFKWRTRADFYPADDLALARHRCAVQTLSLSIHRDNHCRGQDGQSKSERSQ